MKTQTTQLSSNDTKKVSGGLNFNRPSYKFKISTEGSFIERPRVPITQAIKETGGRFCFISY